MSKRKNCCVCNQETPSVKQWWNRDRGFGICVECAERESKRLSEEEMKFTYGVEGIHYFKKNTKRKTK